MHALAFSDAGGRTLGTETFGIEHHGGGRKLVL